MELKILSTQTNKNQRDRKRRNSLVFVPLQFDFNLNQLSSLFFFPPFCFVQLWLYCLSLSVSRMKSHQTNCFNYFSRFSIISFSFLFFPILYDFPFGLPSIRIIRESERKLQKNLLDEREEVKLTFYVMELCKQFENRSSKSHN